MPCSAKTVAVMGVTFALIVDGCRSIILEDGSVSEKSVASRFHLTMLRSIARTSVLSWMHEH